MGREGRGRLIDSKSEEEQQQGDLENYQVVEWKYGKLVGRGRGGACAVIKHEVRGDERRAQ